MAVTTTISPGPRSTEMDGLTEAIESHPIWTELRGPDTPKMADWVYDTVQAGKLAAATSYTPTGNYTEKTTSYNSAGDPTGAELDLSNPDPGFASSYVTSQTWTSTHLPATMTPAPGGGLPSERILYQYDAFGDPTGTTGYSAYVSAASYSPYGEPNQYTLGVNNQTGWLTYSRDAETRRVTGINLSAQAVTPQLENIAYTYDQSGNITRSVDTQGAAGTPVQTQCYTYDALSQLTQAWSANDNCAADPTKTSSNATVGGPQPYWLTWTIDTAGGRTGQVNHALPGATGGDTSTTYSNGVSSPDTHAHALASTATTGAQTGASTYGYDADGNTTTRAVNNTTQQFTYTRDGHTNAITTTTGSSGPQSTTYSYDADGTTLIRRDPGSTTLYVGDEELTRDTTTGVLTGIRYYQHNGTTVAMRTANSAMSFLFGDLQGTAQTAVPIDSSGWLIPVRRHFDPYGNPLANTDGTTTTGGSWPDNHAFLDKPASTTTSLSDVGARKYDPLSGHFLSVDPIADQADPQSLNGYAYGDNDPTNNSDPTGTRILAPPGAAPVDGTGKPVPTSNWRGYEGGGSAAAPSPGNGGGCGSSASCDHAISSGARCSSSSCGRHSVYEPSKARFPTTQTGIYNYFKQGCGNDPRCFRLSLEHACQALGDPGCQGAGNYDAASIIENLLYKQGPSAGQGGLIGVALSALSTVSGAAAVAFTVTGSPEIGVPLEILSISSGGGATAIDCTNGSSACGTDAVANVLSVAGPVAQGASKLFRGVAATANVVRAASSVSAVARGSGLSPIELLHQVFSVKAVGFSGASTIVGGVEIRHGG